MTKTILRLLALFLAAAVLAGCYPKPPAETTAPTETSAPTEIPVPTDPPGTNCYTYRDSLTALPVNWSPLDWATEADEYILSLTSMGLYAPALSADGSGYEILPEMAAGEPVDVTKEYAGSDLFPVPQDAREGYAYRIDLNPNAVWEDGTPINADTYLYSMQALLSAEGHLRASSFDSGNLVLAGAFDYRRQDMVGQVLCRSLADAGYSSVAEAVNDGAGELYLDMKGFWGMDAGWQSIENDTLFRDPAVPAGQPEDHVSAKYLYDTYLAEGNAYDSYQTAFIGLAYERIDQTLWKQVGLLKTGEYQITLVLEKPLDKTALQHSLFTGWLVHKDSYEQFGAAYGTGVDSTMSCGPYRLDSLSEDGFLLTRNESWYGWQDENHAGQYQATAVSCKILTEEAALDAFEAGLLDTVNAAGENAMTLRETYTSKLTLNSSLAALGRRERDGINKTILCYPDFRKAISLALDRQAFVQACTPNDAPAFGLLSGAFISDLATGERYRGSEAGQSVLQKLYDTEELSAITGCDLSQAGKLMQRAYNAAASDRRISGNDIVELEFLTYSDDETYEAIVAFVQQALDAAAEDTSLEGRIRVVLKADPDYYNTARTGQFEIILSTWGGSEADPYSILSCYCDREKAFEFGFDPSKEFCTLTIDGASVTKTYRGWYDSLMNGKYRNADPALRLYILSGLEYSLLTEYACIPLYERNLSFMDSGRLRRPVEEGVPLLGFGGIRYAEFTEDDAAWGIGGIS